jgi:hypothetical protein
VIIRWRGLGLVVGCSWMAIAQADPWLAPGDDAVRADVLLLADVGIIHGPVNTWPLSWPDIARDVRSFTRDETLDEAAAAALRRVQRQARAAASDRFSGLRARASAAHDPPLLRGFADSPREAGEVELGASYIGGYVAVNLQGTAVVNPDDGQRLRPDGSYLGLNAGNFMFSAGYMERWWGPGWDGTLALSTNARPIPSLTMERNYTDPFKSRLLSWIGPWRASIAVGEAEKDDVAVPGVRFFAARVDFKPKSWLEFGLTRTAQWCGEGRPCSLRIFKDMLLGRDNQVVDGDIGDQPGNQMAGYDMRLRSPWRSLPLAFYTQWIGEDEAGNLPSKFLGQFGVETWASTRFGGLRARLEYVDTTCTFTRQDPEFNCAYRNGLYPQGYSYRGRIIGDSLDNDSRMYSLGVILTRPDSSVFSLTLRHARINRDGAGTHAISEVPLDLDNVELRCSRVFGFGKVIIDASFEDSRPENSGSGVRGFVSWQQGF